MSQQVSASIVWSRRSNAKTECPCRSPCRCRPSSRHRQVHRRSRRGARAHRDTSGSGHLAEVEQRFSEWEALAHVGRWLWDVGTNAVQWSDELHRMHGVDPLEFEGTLAAHLAVVHPDDRERVRTLMEGAVASRLPFEDEYRVDDSSGETRWFACAPSRPSARPVTSSGYVASVRTSRSAPSDDEPHALEQIVGRAPFD